jgi:hypothetical protein
MNDVVIFTVGFGVMGIGLASTLVALIAKDYPDEPDQQATANLTKSSLAD